MSNRIDDEPGGRMTDKFLDFRVVLEQSNDPTSVVYSVTADWLGGQYSGTFEVPFADDELDEVVRGVVRGDDSPNVRDAGELEDGNVAVDDRVREWGTRLYDALMTGKVGARYERALDQMSTPDGGAGVRLTLSLRRAPRLMCVPWELLNYNNDFLATQRDTPVVRQLADPRATPPPPPASETIQILGIIASTTSLASLKVDDERRHLEAIGDVDDARVEFTWLKPATWDSLRDALGEDKYHVIHFIGHSKFDDANGGALYFANPDESSHEAINPDDLRVVLGDSKKLRLVVLNSCEAGRTPETDPYGGLATSLIENGVPAVIAMQYKIRDDAAIKFAKVLYTSLIHKGRSIEVALAEARQALWINKQDRIGWATPVLYVATPDVKVFDFEPAAPALVPRPEPPDIAPVPRSRRRRRRFTIAAATVAAAAVVVSASWVWLRNDTSPTTGPTCGNSAVPAPPKQSPMTADQAAMLGVLQGWADLVASAQPDQDNTAVYNQIKAVYPTWSVASADVLTRGYGNLEASYMTWVRANDDGTFIAGQIVYDNASAKPCRTGYLCWLADVDGDLVTSMKRGGLAESNPLADYPYIENQWVSADEVIPQFGITVRQQLDDSCRGANYT